MILYFYKQNKQFLNVNIITEKIILIFALQYLRRIKKKLNLIILITIKN